jgi:hypothetical protein
VVFVVGVASADTTALLAARPEAYSALAARASLDLATPDLRAGYLKTFLETTRSFAKRFQIVASVDDLQARPNLDKNDEARFRDLQAKYRDIVKPLALGNGPPWKGGVFAVKDQSLVRIDLELDAGGLIRTSENELEKDLPIPYAI